MSEIQPEIVSIEEVTRGVPRFYLGVWSIQLGHPERLRFIPAEGYRPPPAEPEPRPFDHADRDEEFACPPPADRPPPPRPSSPTGA